jgi:long-chain acyl-CoA synthetase
VREGHTVDSQELREFLRTNLAGYKVPRRIEIVDTLPRSLIGKVLRREVRDSMLAKRNA